MQMDRSTGLHDFDIGVIVATILVSLPTEIRAETLRASCVGSTVDDDHHQSTCLLGQPVYNTGTRTV